MPGHHPLEPVDESFFTRAPHVYSFVRDLPVAPQRVWQSLVSDHSVADWTPLLASIEWTSPRPFGIGSTRTVVLPAKALTIREYFFLWQEGQRFAFHGVDASLPLLSRFAEDYLVEPNGSGTRFTWTFALAGTRWTRPLLKVLSPGSRLAFAGMARGATGYFATHP